MRRIRKDLHLLAHDLLTNAVAAPFLREEAPSFVRLTRVRRETQDRRADSATAAGSRTTVYLPGSIAAGFVTGGLLDRRGGERGRIELTELAVGARRPADPDPSGVRAVRL